MDRADLGFIEAATAAFNFLIDDFGFRLVRIEPPTFLHYESAELVLDVHHGRQSYELDVRIGCVADCASRRFGLSDVLDATAACPDGQRTYFQASTPEAVRRCIETIAGLVSKHYGSVLRGDVAVLKCISDHAAKTDAAYTKSIVEQPTREAAEKAWRDRDYPRVQSLYASIRDGLTVVERGRLEHAKKHARR